MSIKLIALDLDGTTLDSAGRLPDENKTALERAIAAGVNVVVASGRCYSALPAEVTKISGVQYAISSNGAMITDMRSGKRIYSNCISKDTIHRVKEIVEEHGYMIEVFVDGAAYMERSIWEDIRDNGINYRRREYIMTTRNPIDDIIGFMMAHDGEIENINFFFESMEEKPGIGKVLSELEDDATLTTSFDHNWEIGGKTTSKAEALRQLSSILGVTTEEMMSFGDSPNDIPMIEAAGLGVAVGNAKESVKEAADYITLSNDDAGVARAVEKFVFGEGEE